MKSLSAALKAHYALPGTTVATCWKVTLADGTLKGFTDHDQNLVVDSVTYLASSGYTATAIESNAALSVDNLEVQGFLDSPSITREDLLAGKWDFATIEIFRVNWADLSMGKDILRVGTIGEVSAGDITFTAELRGLTQQLQENVGEIVTARCRADLGDDRCKIDLTPLTVTGTITSVTDRRTFSDSSRSEADDYFGGGLLTFTSGDNDGIAIEVKSFSAGAFVLQLPAPYDIAVDDTYSVYPGCRKRFSEDCVTKFDNAVNFIGEPDVPGMNQILQPGGV